jgi:hypothetical protein
MMLAQWTPRDVAWEFIDLLSRDDELMRAEFQAIINAEWPPGHPRVADDCFPGPDTDGRIVAPKGLVAPVSALREQRSRQHRRERSPPELPSH